MSDVAVLVALDPRNAGPSDGGLRHDPAFADLLAGSYRRLLGMPLAPQTLGDQTEAARWLYELASFCLLAHNTAADPRFVYANRAAQRCFELSWDEITSLPSRLSADAPNRAERDSLIETVARAGFATAYRGLRIAKSGRRFWIEDVTMWQLIDAAGEVRGQAALYSRWRDAETAHSCSTTSPVVR